VIAVQILDQRDDMHAECDDDRVDLIITSLISLPFIGSIQGVRKGRNQVVNPGTETGKGMGEGKEETPGTGDQSSPDVE